MEFPKKLYFIQETNSEESTSLNIHTYVLEFVEERTAGKDAIYKSPQNGWKYFYNMEKENSIRSITSGCGTVISIFHSEEEALEKRNSLIQEYIDSLLEDIVLLEEKMKSEFCHDYI